MSMLSCPRCDRSLPESANYCSSCGEPLTSAGQKKSSYVRTAHEATEGFSPSPYHVMRPATVNVRRSSRSVRAPISLIYDRPNQPEYDESRGANRNGRYHSEAQGLTWHKEVIPASTRTLPPASSPPPQLRPVILTPPRTRRHPPRIPPAMFFWVSAALFIVIVLGGLFGTFVTWGHGLLNSSSNGGLSLQIAPDTVLVGATMTLRGTNFSPRGRVGLTRDTAVPLVDTAGSAIITADAHGNFIDTAVISRDWEAGVHIINAEDATTHKIAQFAVTIIGQDTSLRPAHLQLSQNAIDFGEADSATNGTQVITLSNVGGGQISWQGTASQPWLLLSPKNGSFASGETEQVMVDVDRSNLKPGAYKASILFSSNAGDTTLPVQMQVTTLQPGHEAVLELTPAVVSFTSTDGTASPPGQVVTVSNPGVQPLSWNASSNASWLTISPASGTVDVAGSQPVTLNVNTSTLLPGTYSATLTFRAGGPNPVQGSPQSIYVSITINPQCSLQISPALLTFTGAYQQPSPSAKTISVGDRLGCSAPIHWTASSTTSWLTLGTTSGTTPTYPSISVNATGLTPGTYNGSILFSSSTGTQTLPVTFILGQSTRPIMATSPAVLPAFNAVIGQANPPTQTVTITNTAGGTLAWNATVATGIGGNWLNVTPASGKLAANQSTSITVKATLLAALTPGIYTGTIMFTGTDGAGNVATGSPQRLSVTFAVQAPCTIAASPLALSFAGIAKQSNSIPAQTAKITASGTCTHQLNWTTTLATTPADGTWLKATISGTVSSTAASAAIVSVAIGSLPIGTYSGTVTITVTDSVTNATIGTPQTVSITFNVQPSCTLQNPSVSQETFTAQAGSNPASQSFTMGVTGTCRGGINIKPAVTLGSGTGWLVVTPNPARISSGGTATFTVAVRSAALPPGSYTASVSLTATNGGVSINGSSQTVGISLTVTSTAALRVDPSALTINVTTGTTSQSFTISNIGGRALNWTARLAAGAPGFVSLSAGSGQQLGAGNSATDNILVNATGLPGGSSYTTSITVNAIDSSTGQAVGSPATIALTISVAAPAMELNTNNLKFSAPLGSNPDSQSINITNAGGGGLQWTVGSSSGSWLSVSPTSGTDAAGASSTTTFSVNTTNMSAGSYTATITITPSVGKAQTVHVRLIITGATPIPMPSPTAIPTPTPSPTHAPTPSPTAIPTPTPSPTHAPTPSPTATPTPTPSPTHTPTPSPTATPTPTPTAAATPTLSPTPIPSPTTTPSPTRSPTGTPVSKTVIDRNNYSWFQLHGGR